MDNHVIKNWVMNEMHKMNHSLFSEIWSIWFSCTKSAGTCVCRWTVASAHRWFDHYHQAESSEEQVNAQWVKAFLRNMEHFGVHRDESECSDSLQLWGEADKSIISLTCERNPLEWHCCSGNNASQHLQVNSLCLVLLLSCLEVIFTTAGHWQSQGHSQHIQCRLDRFILFRVFAIQN